MLCIDYLNLPSFESTPTKQLVLDGEYGFMEYAVLYWVRHLEAGLSNITNEDSVLEEFAESLGVFLDVHWKSPTATIKVPKKVELMLDHLKTYSPSIRLGPAIASTKKQLRHFGELRKEECALDLGEVVARIRTQLELVASESLNALDNLEPAYGLNLFRCPRFSCHYFTHGFLSEPDRRKHLDRHERPHRCTDEICVIGFIIGFATPHQLAKHIKDNHSASSNLDEQFPSEQEIAQSMRKDTDTTLVNEPMPSIQPPEAQESESASHSESESDSGHASQHEVLVNPSDNTPYTKQKRQTEFSCEHCGKTFGKRYNWFSHLKSHGASEQFRCSQCGTVCARQSDFTRHMRSHAQGKRYACHGVFDNGQRCGKVFVRADILRSHHKSKKGQRCFMSMQG